MKSWIRNGLVNLLLLTASLLICALAFEFVVFKYLLKASDYPILAVGETVTRYGPLQTGVYRVQDEISARYTINRSGWNSGAFEYATEKRRPRVLIIGDSYLAAFQVDSDQSVAERLESLGEGDFHVYRMGIDGAPLSQYLHMLREEGLFYAPDLVVFNIVHNDITESYRTSPGVYTDSFLHFVERDGVIVGEKPPIPFQRKWYSFIRRSNMWRYLSVRRQVRFQHIRDIVLGPRNAAVPAVYQGNIDFAELGKTKDADFAATLYGLQQAKIACESVEARLLVAVDGVRSLIYSNPNGPFDEGHGALKINAMVRKAGAEAGVPVVDLHNVFARHYRLNGQRFEFNVDGHWNELGHKVAAQALFDAIRSKGLLDGRTGRRGAAAVEE